MPCIYLTSILKYEPYCSIIHSNQHFSTALERFNNLSVLRNFFLALLHDDNPSGLDDRVIGIPSTFTDENTLLSLTK